MNYQELLAKCLATMKSKQDEMGEIMTKSAEAGTTPSDEDETKIKAIEEDIAKLQTNANRLKGLIAAGEKAKETATPVAGESEQEAQDTAKGVVHVANNMDAGIGFALMVKASAIAAKSKGSISTIDVLKSWNAPEHIQNAIIQKSTVGTTTDTNFASSLVDYANLTGEFIDLVRKKTVVDKLAAMMREVPFNAKIPEQTASGTVGWVGEAKPKPTGNPQFGTVTLGHSKIAGIVVLSDELIRMSNPKADGLVRDDLVSTTAEFIDQQFFDPTKAEAEESPASILNGLTAVTSAGVTAENYDSDLNKVISQVTDAGLSLEGAHWIMGETRAATMSGLRDALGRKYFEGMELTGSRSLKGLPVETTGAADDKIVLVIPGQILLADDGQADFSVSTEATINMGTEAAPQLVHLYQENLTAIRAERFIRWKKRRANAAGYIQY